MRGTSIKEVIHVKIQLYSIVCLKRLSDTQTSSRKLQSDKSKMNCKSRARKLLPTKLRLAFVRKDGGRP
jgi:hypothetical protein